MEEAIKRVINRKAAGDEDVDLSRDILKMLREDSLELRTRTINNMHETGEWPNNFI
jgi:hypothetical protein